jgi:formyltetrahydrofolate deformylase
VIFLMSCPDQPGIIARVTGLLFDAGLNVLDLEQHVEEAGLFFMRIHADTAGMRITGEELEYRLRELMELLGADLRLHDPAERPRVCVLVSSEPAPLQELLSKREQGVLGFDLPMVIGDKEDLRPLAERYGVPFRHVPMDPGDRLAAEAVILGLLEECRADLVVLARYMRILSAGFVDRYAQRIINIHHSFLPAFKGNRPYHQAWERGVKMIGATAHFATADLDEGPIIAQDAVPVTHQHSVEEMIARGAEIERRVLAEAVQVWLERRVIVHGRRTVVFH